MKQRMIIRQDYFAGIICGGLFSMFQMQKPIEKLVTSVGELYFKSIGVIMENPTEILRQHNILIDPSDRRDPSVIVEAFIKIGIIAPFIDMGEQE